MSAQTHRIIPGMRIAQIIFERAITPEINQVDQLDQTGRGEQGFGSTDQVSPKIEVDKAEYQLIRRFVKTRHKVIGPRTMNAGKFK